MHRKAGGSGGGIEPKKKKERKKRRKNSWIQTKMCQVLGAWVWEEMEEGVVGRSGDRRRLGW